MKRIRGESIRLLVVSSLFCFSLAVAPVGPQGCAQYTPTTVNENVVVNAEKTLRVSKDTFDIFLKLEKQNSALIKSKFPQVHTFAEYIRRNAPGWLLTANDLKNQYKHNGAGLQALQAALSILAQNSSQAQTYINQING